MNNEINLKEALKNYKDNKARIQLGIANDETKQIMNFIDKCISILDPDERDIILALYFNRKNISNLSEKGCFARSAFYKKADKIVARMELFYSELM